MFLPPRGCPPSWPCPAPDGAPGRGSVPSYPSPERAAAALARVSRYARWRSQPVGEFVRPPGVDTERARAAGRPASAPRGAAILDRRRGPGAAGLLRHRGDRVPAGRAASRRRWPRRASWATRWRSRRSGTAGTTAPTWSGCAWTSSPRPGSGAAHAELSRAHRARTRSTCSGWRPRACPACSRCVDDPSFGSLLSFGLSGMATELLGDRAFRAVPVSDRGRRGAGPGAAGGAAADRLPGQRAGPAGRAGGPGAAAGPDGRGPARAARAQPGPGARLGRGRVRHRRPGWCSARRPPAPTPGPRRLR